MWFAFLAALLVTVILGFFLPSTVPAYIGLAVGALVWLAGVANDDLMMYCGACHKRVKTGASTCHHCGYARD